MADELKKPDIKLVETQPESVFDDIEGLRKTATLKVSRRVVPVNVAVKRPPNNVYFRCHHDPAMSLDASVLIGDEGRDDFYFITPFMLNHHMVLPRLRKVTIAVVCSWPGGAISLWPVPIVEETRIACWKSARAAFELSKEQWVQLCWNNRNLRDLLRLGFSDRIIASADHPYVQRLRGVAE